MDTKRLGTSVGAIAVIGALGVAGCGGSASTSPSGSTAGSSTTRAAGGAPTGTLVIDNSFVDKGIDPGREFTPTNNMLVKAMYDTLVTFAPGKTTPVPDLAASWKGTRDAKSFTFTLADAKFSDGTPVTSADVKFSLDRLVNLQSSGSFLLDGVTVTAPDARTVVVTSRKANPALLRILATPPTSILNSRVLEAHGGSDAKDASRTDRAEAYLQTASAGSGPYVLDAAQQNQQYTLRANPNYWGTAKGFPKVVVRNMAAPTQLLNVQRGSNEIALDLSAQQAGTLKSNGALQVTTDASVNIFDVEANMDSSVSPTGDQAVRKAIRLALDYEGYTRLSGEGAVQAPGVIPSQFLGALPQSDAVRQDLNAARAALGGRTGIKVKLAYPSDATPNGVSFASVAQKVKSDLGKIGIDVTLDGSPAVTFLKNYAAGRNQMSVSYWGPDYPDPNDYLVYAPGAPGSSRAADNKYTKAMAPEIAALGAKAGSTLDDTQRGALFQEFQRDLNEDSPFFPLFQPAQAIVGSRSLSNVVLDPTYTLNIAAVGSN